MSEECTAWSLSEEDPYGEKPPEKKVIVKDDKVVMATRCPCKCPKKCIFVIASYVTKNYSSWDLTPYKYMGRYHKYARWRLIETKFSLVYGKGKVTKFKQGTKIVGELEGLPDKFTSKYAYAGYMELQQGCYNPKTGETTWP